MKLSKKIRYVIAGIIVAMLVQGNIAKAATVEVTTETLNLRREPTTDSSIVALISEGEECEVLGEQGDWYEVRYGDHTGYVSKEYVKLIGGESESGTESNEQENNETNGESNTNSNNEESNTGSEANAEEQTSNQNETVQQEITATTKGRIDLKITPLMQGSVLGTVPNNTEVTVISQTTGWAYVQTDSISGWVRKDNLNIKVEETQDNNTNNENTSDTTDNQEGQADTDETTDNTTEFAEKTMYTVDYVNIRKEPSTSADVLMVVSQNTALTVIGETGDWYEVRTSQGNAFVSKEVLSETETEVTSRGNVERVVDTEENTTEEKNTAKEEVEKVSNTSNSETSSSATTSTEKEIVDYAKQYLGVPYVYGGASPSGFDCSGFTMYVYKKFGISMSHSARAQSKLGKEVKVDEASKSSILNNLEAGDLVFFLDYETMDKIGHCGIYIGDGNFIHASSGSGYCVKINSLLPGEYYNTRFCATRRVI